MKAGVVGLGQMGLPIAAGLVGVGVEVVAFDCDPARHQLAVEYDVAAAPSVAEVLSQALVLTVLPSDAAVKALCIGADAMLALMPRGGVHLCMGTLGVATAELLTAAHAEAGQVFIACPVFGRPDEAWARDLTAVFGYAPGSLDSAVACARVVVGHLAPRMHEVASPAAACAVKLAGNQMIASAIATMTECFGLVEAHGVAPPVLHAIVTGKLFRGPVYQGVGSVLSGATAPPAVPGFTLRLGLKDADLVAEAAQKAGHTMPMSEAARARLVQAVAAGHGARDWAELSRCLSP